MRRNRFVLAGVVVVSLFAAVSLRAADEADHAAVGRATEIFKWINFAIVAGVIVWVFGKLLPPVFRKKADAISSAIKNATNAKAAADAQLREAEAKLLNLEKEVERLRAATDADAQKIATAAKAEIEAAERAARLELKALAANLAVDGAETLLATKLTPQTQESLISNFVKSLEGRLN